MDVDDYLDLPYRYKWSGDWSDWGAQRVAHLTVHLVDIPEVRATADDPDVALNLLRRVFAAYIREKLDSGQQIPTPS